MVRLKPFVLWSKYFTIDGVEHAEFFVKTNYPKWAEAPPRLGQLKQ